MSVLGRCSRVGVSCLSPILRPLASSPALLNGPPSSAAPLSQATHRNENNVIYGPTPTTPLPTEDLHTLIFTRAAKWSHLDAAECSVTGRKYTYGGLMDRALRWAGVLSKVHNPTGSNGVKNVALFLTNAPEFSILLLGTLAAGATITTINTNYTAEEVARQLQESGADVIVTDPHLQVVVTEAFGKIKRALPMFVNGDSNDHPNLRQLLEDPTIPFAEPVLTPPSTIATILFSSGTTGKPKGVEMSHAAYTANLATFTHPHFYAIQPAGEEREQDTVTGVMPNYHIYGMYVINLLSLYQGAKVVSFPAFDPQAFVRVIREHKVRVVHLVPPMLNFLVKAPSVTSADLDSVGVVMCAAAPVPPTTAQELKDKAPNKVLFQEGFGMTEVIGTHLTPLNDERLGWCGKVAVGVAAKVVDEDGKTLPEGQKGEMWVKTPSLMTCYHNNPESTAESITSDGWFRTGDVAIHQEGFFSIVDRIKELIKVKGFQVSPSELEDLLLQHPGVKDVGVVGVKDERAGELPRAYVIKGDVPTTEDDLHSFIAPRVAEFKHLKGGIVFVDELPKNSTGKLLRKELKLIAESES